MKKYLPFLKSRPKVAVLRLNGQIAAGGRGLNDASLAPVIEKAFRSKPDAVALAINSPGGSPVQSSLIGSRIRRLADKHDVPVVAFVEDVAASGGYWLACAADEIYVDATSMIGSIGVIYAGFGFDGLIDKHGVDRRVHTAGKSKSLMDPFSPEKPGDVKQLKGWLEQTHEVFKAHVTARRGGKLSGDQDLFTGAVWVGQKGVDLGLADGIGHLVPMMQERFGDKVRFRKFERKRPMAARFGMSLAQETMAEVEERLSFARFGL